MPYLLRSYGSGPRRVEDRSRRTEWGRGGAATREAPALPRREFETLASYSARESKPAGAGRAILNSRAPILCFGLDAPSPQFSEKERGKSMSWGPQLGENAGTSSAAFAVSECCNRRQSHAQIGHFGRQAPALDYRTERSRARKDRGAAERAEAMVSRVTLAEQRGASLGVPANVSYNR